MHRRTFLAALVCALGSASVASADVAPSPPSPVTVEGARTMITTSGGPDHATYTIHNGSDRPMEVFLDRVLHRDRGMNVPLRVERARADGRDLGRRFTVPAGAEMQVVVFFETANRRGSSWDLTLRVMVDGRRIEGTAHVTRAIRDPARKSGRDK